VTIGGGKACAELALDRCGTIVVEPGGAAEVGVVGAGGAGGDGDGAGAGCVFSVLEGGGFVSCV
jgi:hypothetical protein